MKLLLSCAELGLGHVSRIIPLGRKLQQQGHTQYFYTGGKAYELLKKEFKNVYECQPISWYENSRGINIPASLLNVLFPLLLFNPDLNRFEVKKSNTYETMQRYYDLRREILKLRPDLIISDGDVNALRLSGRWSIPSIYVENMIRPGYGFSFLLSPGERFVERYYRIPQKIIIPDNPPPYTVSEYSIGDLKSLGVEDRTEFVGSFIDTTPEVGGQENVFVPISGPVGTRSQLINTILPVLKNAKGKCVISLGTPGTKNAVKIKKHEIYTWLSTEERRQAMLNAKYVIFSGGHATCFETIKFGKPSICIPTQPEQLGNAAKMEKMGVSILVRNSRQLAAAFEKMEAELDIYTENARRLSEFSGKFRGLNRAVEIIESAVS